MNYYEENFNKDKASKLFNLVPLHKDHLEHCLIIPILWGLAAHLISAVVFTGPFLFLLIQEILFRYKLKIRLLNQCEEEEFFLDFSYREGGIDPNFPEDPCYVVDEDRYLIYRSAIKNIRRLKRGQKTRFRLEAVLWAFILLVLPYGLILMLHFVMTGLL